LVAPVSFTITGLAEAEGSSAFNGDKDEVISLVARLGSNFAIVGKVGSIKHLALVPVRDVYSNKERLVNIKDLALK